MYSSSNVYFHQMYLLMQMYFSSNVYFHKFTFFYISCMFDVCMLYNIRYKNSCQISAIKLVSSLSLSICNTFVTILTH